jgi:hypothetical protein
LQGAQVHFHRQGVNLVAVVSPQAATRGAAGM